MAANNGSGPSSDGNLAADLLEVITACLIVGAIILASIFVITPIMLQLIFSPETTEQMRIGSVPPSAIWISLIVFQIAASGLILAVVRLMSPGAVRFTFALGWPQASFGSIVLLFAIVTAFQALFSMLTSIFFPVSVQNDLGFFRDLMKDAPLVLTAIALIIGAPVSEELLFRGYLMNRISQTRLGFGGATIVSTTLWTLLHTGYSTVSLVEVFIAGLLFSWVLWKTRSLWVTIAFHAAYNGFVYTYLIMTQPPPAV